MNNTHAKEEFVDALKNRTKQFVLRSIRLFKGFAFYRRGEDNWKAIFEISIFSRSKLSGGV